MGAVLYVSSVGHSFRIAIDADETILAKLVGLLQPFYNCEFTSTVSAPVFTVKHRFEALSWTTNIVKMDTESENSIVGFDLVTGRYLQRSHGQLFAYMIGSESIEVSTSGDSDVASRVLKRVVYINETLEARRMGALHIHGSSAAIGQESVVFVGAKGAGKTTVLCECMRQGWSFVSNDQVLLYDDDCVTTRGLPIDVNIRDGTLQMYADILGRRCENVQLSPRDVAAAFGVEVLPSAQLRGIVVLDRRPNTEFFLHKLSIEKDVDIFVNQHVLRLASLHQPFWHEGRMSSGSRSISRFPLYIATYDGPQLTRIVEEIAKVLM
jgi:hypothetical protein